MIGTSEKYRWLETSRLNFPHRIKAREIGIDTEREFIEFLLRNDWVQRRLGIKMEYHAENYRHHGHAFKGCDLIISLIRSEETRFVKGVPVWSFYYRDEDELIFCLDDDINYDFNKHGEDDD